MSAENTPAVALLFEDAEQSAHLREALRDLGAHIVHEGPATALDASALADSGAQVVVINLDAAVEEHLDRIYDAVDLDRQRVVFNDAEASHGLSGWDQARWARHLAAKLMDQFDTDPPRPADARPVEVAGVAAAVAEEAVGAEAAASVDASATDVAADANAAAAAGPAEDVSPDENATGSGIGQADESLMMREDASGESAGDDGALTSEFDALLAEGRDLLGSADEGDDADDFARVGRDDEVLGFDTGDLDASEDAPTEEASWQDPSETSATSETGSEETASEDAADDTQPTASGIDWDAVEAVAPDAEQQAPAKAAEPDAPAAPDWGLVDFNANAGDAGVNAVRPDQESGKPEDFGIQKLSAAEFLTPEGDGEESPIEPGLSLELVSLEEAVRPQMAEGSPSYEMSLETGTKVRHVVAIGATADATGCVRAFLDALPARPAAALLLIQHADDGDHETYVTELAEAAPFRVRMAEHGASARNGELLVIPPGQRLQLDRDGRVTLAPADARSDGCDPSIDDGFSAVAMAFGEDAFAVLLVSDANDAVAGAQVVRERGGRVWLHQHGDEDASSMAAMLRRESLVDQEDTPQALAQRLIDAVGAL